MSEPIIQIEHLNKTFGAGPTAVHALEDINLAVQPGEIFGIIGLSGAGKSTLVRCMNLLERPTSGSVVVDGKEMTKLSTKDLNRARQSIGMIFQSFNLLPKLTALENVLLSMDISGCKYEDKKAHAMELLKKVDIGEAEANRRILKLCGGQQQRVAIARALSYGPGILVADEPTGNLDPETQEEIMKIFLNLAHKEDCCVIIVTHSREVAKAADQVYRLEA